MKKRNKYEDIEMIDLDDKAEISDIYIEHLYNTDKTVGFVTGKELAEYVLQNVINLEETSVKEINFIDLYDINEYLISVNDEGHIVATPIDELYNVFDDVDIVYIDMDGDIEQDVIDYCVNENKEVILFGETDDKDCECVNCKHTSSTTNYFINDKAVSKEEYEDAMAELDVAFRKHIDTILDDYSDFVNEMNNWRKLFEW